MTIDRETMELIEVARKYRLRVGTLKCDIFRYFDQGYTPIEVRFILGKPSDGRLYRSLFRYYYDWKQAQ